MVFFYYYTVNNGRNYSYNSNHNIYNNNCNFIISKIMVSETSSDNQRKKANYTWVTRNFYKSLLFSLITFVSMFRFYCEISN